MIRSETPTIVKRKISDPMVIAEPSTVTVAAPTPLPNA